MHSNFLESRVEKLENENKALNEKINFLFKEAVIPFFESIDKSINTMEKITNEFNRTSKKSQGRDI